MNASLLGRYQVKVDPISGKQLQTLDGGPIVVRDREAWAPGNLVESADGKSKYRVGKDGSLRAMQQKTPWRKRRADRREAARWYKVEENQRPHTPVAEPKGPVYRKILAARAVAHATVATT